MTNLNQQVAPDTEAPKTRKPVRAGRDFMRSISQQVTRLISSQNTSTTGRKSYKLDRFGIPLVPFMSRLYRPHPNRVSGKKAWKARGKMSGRKYAKSMRFGGHKSLR